MLRLCAPCLVFFAGGLIRRFLKDGLRTSYEGRHRVMAKKQKRKRSSAGLPTTSVLPKASAPEHQSPSLPSALPMSPMLNGGEGLAEPALVDDGSGAAAPAVVVLDDDGIGCKHMQSGINLEKVRAQLAKGVLFQCHECAKGRAGSGKDKKGKGKVVKKKLNNPASLVDGSASNLGQKLWICLACGQVGCASDIPARGESSSLFKSDKGDEVSKLDSQAFNQPSGVSHARSHSGQWQHSHPLAMQCGDNLACWCFVCKVQLLNYDTSADNSSEATRGRVEGLHMLGSRSSTSPKSELLQQVTSLVRDKLSQDASHVKVNPLDNCRGSECEVDKSTMVSPKSVVGEYQVRNRRVIKGLMNLGNTCFFNSVMQNLVGVNLLRDHFSVEASVREGPLTTALRKFYQEIDPVPAGKADEFVDSNLEGHDGSSRRTTRSRSFGSSIGTAYTPRGLFAAISLKAPRFKGFQQQDSHELLRCLLDGLHTEEESMRKENQVVDVRDLSEVRTAGEADKHRKVGDDANEDKGEGDSVHRKGETFVEQMFGGQLSSTVSCCECGHSSVVYEPFLDLSLPIPSKQPSRKNASLSLRNQLPISVIPRSQIQSQRVPAYEDGRKGFEGPVRAKKMTANGLVDLTVDLGQSSGNRSDSMLECSANSVAGVSDDSGGIQQLGTAFSAEDHATSLTLPPVICLPYPPAYNNCGDHLDTGWLDYTGEDVEMILGRAENDVNNKAEWSVVSESQHTDSRAQALDSRKEESVGMSESGQQSPSHLQESFYSLGTAEEACGLNGDSWENIDKVVAYGPRSCPTNEAANACTRQEKVQQLDMLPHLSEHSSSGDGTAGDGSHPGSSSSTVARNTETEGMVLTLENEQNDLFGMLQLFEEATVFEKEAAHLTDNQAEAINLEASSSFMFMDSVDDVSDCGSNRVEGESFLFVGNGGGLGLTKEVDEEDAYPTMSLEGCLLAFTKSELLSGENSWGCENCSRMLQREVSNSEEGGFHNSDLEPCSQDLMPEMLGQVTNSESDVSATYELVQVKGVDHKKQPLESLETVVTRKTPLRTGYLTSENSLEEALSGMNLFTKNVSRDSSDLKEIEYSNIATEKVVEVTQPKMSVAEGVLRSGPNALEVKGGQDRVQVTVAPNDWQETGVAVTSPTESSGLILEFGNGPTSISHHGQLAPNHHETQAVGVKQREEKGLRSSEAGGLVQAPYEIVNSSTGAGVAEVAEVAEAYIAHPEDERAAKESSEDIAVSLSIQCSNIEPTVKQADVDLLAELPSPARHSLALNEQERDSCQADLQLSISSPIEQSSPQDKSIDNSQIAVINPIMATDSRRIPMASAAARDDIGCQSKSSKADRVRRRKVTQEAPKVVTVKREATKRFLISKAPPILTVHLKRFAQDMRGRLSKLSGHVTFHESLDLSPFMDRRCVS